MILLCGLVEFSVINAHSSSYEGSLWNQLVLAVFHYCHASFLGHALDGAHPLTVRDRINDPIMQELENIFLTTSLMVLFNLRWGSLEGVMSRSRGIQCVQRAGMMPLRS